MKEYEVYFKSELAAIENELEKRLPPLSNFPPVIHEAMRYSVFPGGKRFRPVLTLIACQAAGGRNSDALIPAAAIELIHCYSLVHDDLPALDNDDERRGKPSCHKRYGEAAAIMTGDALLTHAFEILSGVKPAQKAIDLVREISTAAGTYGMIGGQAAELQLSPQDLNLPKLDYISSHKTGMLIKACATSGAIAAGASREDIARMRRYGEAVGLAFQFIDDLLDGDGYLGLMSAEEIREKSRDLIARAKRAIHPFGKKGEKLLALGDFLLERLPQHNVQLDR